MLQISIILSEFKKNKNYKFIKCDLNNPKKAKKNN